MSMEALICRAFGIHRENGKGVSAGFRFRGKYQTTLFGWNLYLLSYVPEFGSPVSFNQSNVYFPQATAWIERGANASMSNE
jgi:hypothetical protein